MEASWAQATEATAHVAMGVGLAACAGLRAFLPMFVVGLAGRFGLVPLSEGFGWLASWPALIVFGAAVVTELSADKFPLVDNLLDGFQTFVKPCAGALLMATSIADWAPLYVTVFWIIAGGSVSGLVHVTKAKLRLLSSATTAGLANPVLSVTEDVGALAGSAVSIVAPFLVAAAVLLGLSLAWIILRRSRRRAS